MKIELVKVLALLVSACDGGLGLQNSWTPKMQVCDCMTELRSL